MAVRVAIGSWADPDYAGLIYPRGFASELRLSALAMWFEQVEVNATYYSTPRAAQVEKWVAATPPSFQFNIRLHRVLSISPEKAAREGRLPQLLLEGVKPLLEAKKLGSFLLVLAPNFTPERHKLDELDRLIETFRPHPLAIELRHADWVSAANKATTVDYFRSQGVTWVAVDMPRVGTLMPPLDEVTQPKLAYLRLHGRNPAFAQPGSAAEKHTYAYSEEEIPELMARIEKLAAKARDVTVVANNHALDYAPRTALALRQALGQL